MDTKQGKAGGGKKWEVRIDIYILLILSIKQVTNENLLCSSGNLRVLWCPTPEGNAKKREYVYTKASQVALVVKNLPAKAGNVRDPGSIPGSGRSPGEGTGTPLQHSCLENPIDRGAW